MNSSFQSCYVHLMELTSIYFRSTSVYTNIHSNQFYSSSIQGMCPIYHNIWLIQYQHWIKENTFDLTDKHCLYNQDVQCTLWTLQLAISHSTDITRQYYGFSMRIFHNGYILKTACARPIFAKISITRKCAKFYCFIMTKFRSSVFTF